MPLLPEALRQELELRELREPEEEILLALILPRSVDLAPGRKEKLLSTVITSDFCQAVGIWATLSVGAAYVPIDPEYPKERVVHILASARPRLVLVREEHASLAGSIRVFGTWQWPTWSPTSTGTHGTHVEELLQAELQSRDEKLSSLPFLTLVRGSLCLLQYL